MKVVLWLIVSATLLDPLSIYLYEFLVFDVFDSKVLL